MSKVKINHLISYKLFCNSKKFNLSSYLEKDTTKTYEEFFDFLVKRKIEPPGEEYFEKVKARVLETKIKNEEIEENFKPLELIEESTKIVEAVLPKKEKTKPKRKRARRKKKPEDDQL